MPETIAATVTRGRQASSSVARTTETLVCHTAGRIAVAAAHPGWVKTDLGSQAAPMEVEEGARTVVELATIAREKFPHGQLVHQGKRLPW